MKILTDKQFEELLTSVRKEAFQEGYEKGKKEGLHQGLTIDKTGVYMCSAGVFVFDNNTSEQSINLNK